MESNERFCSRFFIRFILLNVVLILQLVSHEIALAQIVSECGTIDNVIAQQDLRAEAPWTAALYFQSTKCDFRPAGNGHGVIIGPDTVLLRGNFMWSHDGYGGIRMSSYSPLYFMVVVGLKSKSPFQADQHTQFLKVASIQPHYLSHDAYSEFDYAIIRLLNPIQFTPFVRPLCVDVLPEEIFDRTKHSFQHDQLTISGFRTGSANSFRSALHSDKESFNFLSPEFCSSKLESDLVRASPSSKLLKAETPCGVSAKSMEGLIDFRLFSGGNDGSSGLAYLKQFLNFTNIEATKGFRPLPNVCFHNGASVVTLYKGKWHLVGIVTESLGFSCEKNLYFVSLVASQNNLNWILQHLRNSPSSFICSNGQSIRRENNICNGENDCLDGSDEDLKTCECGPQCGSSRCLLQPMCKHCAPSDSLKILMQTYKFSTAQNAQRKPCPPISPPKDASVYCKAPGLRSHIPCEHEHFSGTQAIFSCKHFTSSTPATYCVITCQENGKWTNELSSFECKPKENENQSTSSVQGQDEYDIEDFSIAVRRNFSASSVLATTEVAMKTSIPKGVEKEGPITFTTKYKDKNGTVMCPPVEVSNGTEVSCWFGTSLKKLSCYQPMYPGSKAEFTCQQYYRPLLSTASVTKHCQLDGEWSLSNRNFECRLDCGIPKKELIGHIVNGRETDGTKWPWHGLIFIDVGQHNYTYICGSTLVSKRIVVTAAHCVSDRYGKAKNTSLYKVAFAAISNIYHKNILDNDIQIFDVSRIVIQPLFNLANFEADIAIIQLSRPVEISDYVRPSCYPSTFGGRTELKHLSPGSMGTVVGFGYDETGEASKTLKEASLPVVSYRECDEVSKIQHSSTQFCAGYTNGTSVCNGDSGSGMFFEEYTSQRRFYLQGIVSHGNRDENSRLCDHNQYSVFTKVGSFKNWISETGYELDEEF